MGKEHFDLFTNQSFLASAKIVSNGFLLKASFSSQMKNDLSCIKPHFFLSLKRGLKENYWSKT